MKPLSAGNASIRIFLAILGLLALGTAAHGRAASGPLHRSSADPAPTTSRPASGCGTLLSDEGARSAVRLERLGAYQGGVGGEGPWQVRTAIHVVRTDQGTGGLGAAQVAHALQTANENLAPAGIILVTTDEIDTIDSDAFYYEIDTTQEINQLRSTNRVEHALNIYFTENLANENGPFCGISSFTWSPYQGVVMANGCVPSPWNPSTFTHELGHYFDLLHTHETAFGMECADGSNCATAGDRLCDTPADPRLDRCGAGESEYCVDSSCRYTGEFTDSCHADPYDPATDNLMSYSRPICRTVFTEGQLRKAGATLLNLRGDHVIDPAGLSEEPAACIAGGPRLLDPPSPNPASDRVTFTLRLPAGTATRARLHDAAGRVVATLIDGDLGPGIHPLVWIPDRGFPSGVYFLRLEAGAARDRRTFVLAR